MSPIKVMIVEDSPVAMLILKRILSQCPEIDIVATAKDGVEAWEMIPRYQPDVICTDLHMAKMDGLELTKKVMQSYPTPILVISASVQHEDTRNVFNLLEAGAIDIFPKPQTGLAADYERLQDELITKIKVLSGVKVFTRHNSSSHTSKSPVLTPEFSSVKKALLPNPTISPNALKSKKNIIVAIGASTGGPQALDQIFSELPANFPAPILCVQHISEGFLSEFIYWLGQHCQLPLKIAKTGELPEPGVIYFPPERHHLELDSFGFFTCYNTTPVDGHCPSVTITFQSVAKLCGNRAIGVLLTGMGKDGALGLKDIAQSGGITIAQNEATSVVFGMPKEAIALGAAKYILPIGSISSNIISQISNIN